MENHGADIQHQLERLYREIETNMDGVPILNSALSVSAFGFEPFQSYYLGVLLTPWFMNLMLVPQDMSLYAESAPRVGEKVDVALPAGRVEFIVSHEERFGHSLSCSLFSPVFEFKDQETATETAKAVLAEVLQSCGSVEEDEDSDMREIWQGRLPTQKPDHEAEAQTTPRSTAVSRREFLRGGTPLATAEQLP